MLGSSLIVASPEHLQHCAKTNLKLGVGGGGGSVYKYLTGNSFLVEPFVYLYVLCANREGSGETPWMCGLT